MPGAAGNLAEALDAVREREPDVLLVDQSAGLKQIFQFVSDAKSTRPRCYPILWIHELAEIDCFRALQLGARGILKKSATIVMAIRTCLRAVSQGEVWIENSLSDRSVSTLDRRLGATLDAARGDIVQRTSAAGSRTRKSRRRWRLRPEP